MVTICVRRKQPRAKLISFVMISLSFVRLGPGLRRMLGVFFFVSLDCRLFYTLTVLEMIYAFLLEFEADFV